MARTRIGLISDTHDLLRPQALNFLQGCDRIVHAGDIMKPEVLDTLNGIAPVIAVRGNNDVGAWADALNEAEVVQVDEVPIFVVHDIADVAHDPRSRDARVIVTGHSHKPHIDERDGVLYVNPGSAGPRRFTLPISIGELMIDGRDVQARCVTLDR